MTSRRHVNDYDPSRKERPNKISNLEVWTVHFYMNMSCEHREEWMEANANHMESSHKCISAFPLSETKSPCFAVVNYQNDRCSLKIWKQIGIFFQIRRQNYPGKLNRLLSPWSLSPGRSNLIKPLCFLVF